MSIAEIIFGKPKTTSKDHDAPPKGGDLPPLPLQQIIDNKRRLELLKLESYLRGTQNDHKRYDWDGRITFNDSELDVAIDAYIPMKRRKPCISLRMGKVIVKRLTTMLFGHDRFPQLFIEGDPDAQDFIRELVKATKLRTKITEARNKGGACGTIFMSYWYVEGRPVIEVHSPGLVDVLEWENYAERIPAKVLKAYDYQQRVFERGEAKKVTLWRVKYWDETIEQTWEDIPDEVVKTPLWTSWRSTVVTHGVGHCPVILVQNAPNSEEVDGISDFDGQTSDFDELDRLASATQKGTTANVDPTVVIHDRKGKDETFVRKGTGTAIYAPGGATYLEIAGTAVEAAKSWIREIKQNELDEAEVVLLDPDKLSGSGVSAASLRVRFAPMLAKCDILRDQYGEAIVHIMTALLEMARNGGVELDPIIETKDIVDLEGNPVLDENGDQRTITTEIPRNPGKSSRVSLKWPPYFPATWEDRKIAIDSTRAAVGNQSVLSQETAVELLASMLDIEDVDAELERIEEDQRGASERAKSIFGPSSGLPPEGNALPVTPGVIPPEPEPLQE